jgi:HD-GYP domain-containing protein (c-di-GMP phosphodiesterase class II)
MGAVDVPERTEQATLRVRCLGVPTSARERLAEIGAEIVEDDAEVDAVLVSTRLPADEVTEVEAGLAASQPRTIVLAHTGAERLAAHLVSGGAHAIVGEGNEEALLGLVDPDHVPNALLTSFERRFGAADTSGRGVDAATGLGDRRSFERRIGTLGDDGEVPRVALCRVLSERWVDPDPDPVVSVQRRRLATSIAHVWGTMKGEVYSIGAGEFGLVGPAVNVTEMNRLGALLVDAAETFRDDALPLRMVVGHAGPESTADPDELVELARRALEVAAVDGARQVLGAQDLALGVSVTTELEAVVRLLDQVEPSLPEGRGHGERVGRMVAELAQLKAWSAAAAGRAQLAGHLHDVGRAGLPAAAVGGPEGLDDDLLEEWREYPERSAQLLRLTAGRDVAETVAAHNERWDGSGSPWGLRGTDIPEAARMLAVVHEVDRLVTVEETGVAATGRRLQEQAGTTLDPDLVALVVSHLPGLLQLRART